MATQLETEGPLIIAAIKAVLDKKAGPQELQQALLGARQGLDEQIKDYQGIIEGLSLDVREKITTLTEAAQEVFGHMDAGLGEIESYLQSGDENSLYTAGSVLRRGAEQLTYIFNEIRNFVLAVAGPTPIPNLNLILRAHEVFVPGKDEKGERLKEFVMAERLAALQSLDQIGEEPSTPELAGLREVWDQHLRAANRLFMAVEKLDHAGVERELESIKLTFHSLYERMSSAVMSQRYQGPTPSEPVNLVLSLSADLEGQVLSDLPLMEALAPLQESCRETADGLEELLKAGVESVVMREEIEKALDAVEYQQEALVEYSEFFENRETLVLRSAAHKLQESTLQLHEALERLGELAEREGKVVCIRCGHYNPPGRGNCEKCSAPLPNLGQQQSSFETAEGAPVAAGAPEGPVLTSNLVRLYQAVDRVHTGEIDLETFLAELDWFAGMIEKNSEFTVEEPNWDELSEEEQAGAEEAAKWMEEIQQIFAQGVTEMQDALELLRQYAETEEKSILEDGVKQMDSGARKVATVGQALKSRG